MTVVIDADTMTFTVGIGQFIAGLVAVGVILLGAFLGAVKLALSAPVARIGDVENRIGDLEKKDRKREKRFFKLHQKVAKLEINVNWAKKWAKKWFKKWVKGGRSGQAPALPLLLDLPPEDE